jgi:hypothetical protein
MECVEPQLVDIEPLKILSLPLWCSAAGFSINITHLCRRI